MIRGTKRPRVKAIEIIEPKDQKVDAKLNASIHNRFDIEVIDAKTGEIKQRAQAENVICNQLWTRLFTPATYYFNYIHYGTGAGTPSASDTSLFTFLNAISIESTFPSVQNVDWENSVFSRRRQIQLSESTSVGAVITEVGIGYSNAASSLCTHAMLKDMNGNQISIEKTSTDIINIYATIFIHGPVYTDGVSWYPQTGNALLDWLTSMQSLSATQDMFMFTPGGFFTCSYNWGQYEISKCTIAYTYNLSEKKLVITGTRIPAGSGNGTKGYRACVFMRSVNGMGHTYPYIPSIYIPVGETNVPASIISAEAIGTGDGTTVDYATNFDFVQAGAKIFIDGVEVITGVSVDLNKVTSHFTNMGLYFKLIRGSEDTANRCPMTPVAATNSTSANHNTEAYPNTYAIYFNTQWALGVASFTRYQSFTEVSVSDDLITWSVLPTVSTGTTTIPEEHRYKKYWRLASSNPTRQVGAGIGGITAYTQSLTNIHFDTPPAPGAVITADYTTKTIAKDANHVFDLTVTIQLGEYTE